MIRGKIKTAFIRAGSVLGCLLFWEITSRFVPMGLFPGLRETFDAFYDNLVQGVILVNLGVTARRVFVGFLVALLIGAIMGLFMGLKRVVEDSLTYPMLFAMSIPSLAWVILGLMWFGLNEFAGIFVISAIVFPIVVINTYEGVKDVDKTFIEMAQAYKASHGKIIFEVILPSTFPYILSACRFGIGVAWKIAIIAEMLGMSLGVGYQLKYYYSLSRMDQVLAWILVFTLVIFIVDRFVLARISALILRWRPNVAL